MTHTLEHTDRKRGDDRSERKVETQTEKTREREGEADSKRSLPICTVDCMLWSPEVTRLM